MYERYLTIYDKIKNISRINVCKMAVVLVIGIQVPHMHKCVTVNLPVWVCPKLQYGFPYSRHFLRI